MTNAYEKPQHKQLIARQRVEALAAIIDEMAVLFLAGNVRSIEFDAGDNQVSVCPRFVFRYVERDTPHESQVHEGLLKAMKALLDDHRDEINSAPTIKIVFYFEADRVLFKSSRTFNQKDERKIDD